MAPDATTPETATPKAVYTIAEVIAASGATKKAVRSAIDRVHKNHLLEHEKWISDGRQGPEPAPPFTKDASGKRLLPLALLVELRLLGPDGGPPPTKQAQPTASGGPASTGANSREQRHQAEATAAVAAVERLTRELVQSELLRSLAEQRAERAEAALKGRDRG